jgi:hypothetical protein
MNLAYFAGLLDGEGCIGFTRIRGQLVPRITITNTYLPLLDLLKKQFGGHINIRPPHQSNWKASSHWVLQNSKAVNLLDKCFKYLLIKEKQAICLFLHDAIRPGIGNRWNQEGHETCKLLEDQIHWLNKKGPFNTEEPMAIAYSEAGEKRKKKKKARK